MKEHQLSNGIKILAEEQSGSRSCAVSIVLPFGAAYDSTGREGLSALTVELLTKGCEGYTARELSVAFEELGAHKSVDCGVESTVTSAVALGENMPATVKLLGKMLSTPTFPAEEIDSCRALMLQDLLGLEDEPASKAQIELFKNFYNAPFNVSHYGTVEGLKAISIEEVRSHHAANFLSADAVICFSGSFDWKELIAACEEAFAPFVLSTEVLRPKGVCNETRLVHLEQPTAQVQLALAYPSVDSTSDDVLTAKVANGVLSGGMCGRLFIEVREKRGLVYRVGSSHSEATGRGAVFAFAGTTPERAQETYDVMLEQLKSLPGGVTEEELSRSKVDLRSSLVIKGESSSARAASMSRDYWNSGRVRTLDEIDSGIKSISVEDVVAFAKSNPVDPITVLTLGSKSVKVN